MQEHVGMPTDENDSNGSGPRAGNSALPLPFAYHRVTVDQA